MALRPAFSSGLPLSSSVSPYTHLRYRSCSSNISASNEFSDKLSSVASIQFSRSTSIAGLNSEIQFCNADFTVCCDHVWHLKEFDSKSREKCRLYFPDSSTELVEHVPTTVRNNEYPRPQDHFAAGYNDEMSRNSNEAELRLLDQNGTLEVSFRNRPSPTY